MKKTLLFGLSSMLISILISCTTPTNSNQNSILSWTGDPNYVSPHNVNSASAQNQMTGLDDDWYKKTSFYHVWIKSFNDSDGNGIGDLQGIIQKLDYIKNSVGCDGIWLSPVFECSYKSGNMHGYDTVDYYQVNSLFGSESDLIELINTCHEKNIKIIFDFVPNHTSTNHIWFKESIADSSYSGKRNWYMWNECALNWKPMPGSSWYKDDTAGSYYYCAFGGGMPDLNYRNYEVREEMKNVVRYWLNKGFDGLRIDAARYLLETTSQQQDTSLTHDFFAELRQEINKYESPKFMVSEAWIENDRATLNKYLGTASKPEFNMVLDFDQGRTIYNSVQNKKDTTYAKMYNNPSDFDGEAYGTFLCNHDVYEDRLATEFNGDSYGMKIATALSLLRPTVPFIYYGQEIGMGNPSGSSQNLGDTQMRGTFNWDKAETQMSEETSILALNKALNNLRHNYDDLFAYGTTTKLSSTNTSVLSYLIKYNDKKLLCVFNLGGNSITSVTLSSSEITENTYSILIGDTDSSMTLTDASAVITNIAPYAYRVYSLGESGLSVLFDDETYDGSSHTIDYNGTYKEPVVYTSMYLRGTMNGWTTTPMTNTSSNTWEVSIPLTAGKYEFKLDPTGSWSGVNWGLGSSITVGKSYTLTQGKGNISINISSSGEYTFSFNTSTEKIIVTTN